MDKNGTGCLFTVVFQFQWWAHCYDFFSAGLEHSILVIVLFLPLTTYMVKIRLNQQLYGKAVDLWKIIRVKLPRNFDSNIFQKYHNWWKRLSRWPPVLNNRFEREQGQTHDRLFLYCCLSRRNSRDKLTLVRIRLGPSYSSDYFTTYS